MPLNNLFEFNSNAKGSYLKFSNGVLICFATHNDTKYDRILELPYDFLDINYIISVQIQGSNYSDLASVKKISNNSFTVYQYNTNAGIVNRPVDIIAIGRWKQ